MQRIEIKNFGPIKNLNLEVKDFMLFIGPQASGKSTIAKTIFFFKSLNAEAAAFSTKEMTIQNPSLLIITTHSPYILAAFNNLILAQKVGKIHPKEVSDKINKHIWIDRNKIYAALVLSGFTLEIMDKELHIEQERIDTASKLINEEFDFLYQFEEPLA